MFIGRIIAKFGCQRSFNCCCFEAPPTPGFLQR